MPLALLGLLLVAAGPALAETVVPDKSEIGFTMKQMGVKFDGRFRKFKADVVLPSKASAAGKAEVDVDLASIDFASGDTESEARDKLWFDTAKFPFAHFASTSFRDLGGDRYEVAGKLTLKGVTRDFVVPIALSRDAAGNRVAQGTFVLKRLDYRVGEGEWADPTVVDNDVVVRVRMVLAEAG
jgi:polyisoprenoid-binding protein YceI